MGKRTGIPYVDDTINCVLGCSKCSAACQNCWAIKTIDRLWACLRHEKYEHLTCNGEWTGRAAIDLRAFDKCLTKKPKRFLLSSLGDWLHESLEIYQCRKLLSIMESYPQHTFFTLTKRPERWKDLGPIPHNVWPGASVWDQASYDRVAAIALDQEVNAWLSIEPMLGPINLMSNAHEEGLQFIRWAVVGAESGKGRRPCSDACIWKIVKQCGIVQVPCYVKQIDIDGHVSTDMKDWPDELCVQELPV